MHRTFERIHPRKGPIFDADLDTISPMFSIYVHTINLFGSSKAKNPKI